MPAIALKAHYDGKHILPDEPWLRAASTAEALNFLADPVEDIYAPEDGEPFRDAASLEAASHIPDAPVMEEWDRMP